MKKIICPNCSTIYEVEDDSVNLDTTCPNCKMTFPTSEGKKALERTYKSLSKKGFNYYTHLEFNKSNECYKEVLEINPDDFEILTRYILNLCYLNTFSSTNYDKVIPLFEEREITLDSKNTYLFLAFLKDFVQNVHVYFDKLNKLVIDDNSFINEIYVKSYLETLLSLKEDFIYFDNVYSLLKEDEKNVYLEDNPTFLERYNKYKVLVNESLTKTYNLISKGDFIFDIDNNNDNDNNKIEIKYLSTNNKNKEERLLEDERIITPSKEFKKEMRNLYIICSSLIVIGIILVIVGFAINNDIVKYIAFIPLIILIIYMIYFYKKISK